MVTETGTDSKDRRGRNRTGNGERGSLARAGRAEGSRDENASVGGGCVGVPGTLQGGGYQLGLAHITIRKEETGDWSRRWGICPRPTWTCESFKKLR